MDRLAATPGLQAAVDQVFMPGVIDPEKEKFKFHDIMKFSMESGAVTDPMSFMRWVNEVDKTTMGRYPKGMPLVDRVWRATQQWTAERALGKLSQGV